MVVVDLHLALKGQLPPARYELGCIHGRIVMVWALSQGDCSSTDGRRRSLNLLPDNADRKTTGLLYPRAMQIAVVRPVHIAHPAATQRGQDAVVSDLPSDE